MKLIGGKLRTRHETGPVPMRLPTAKEGAAVEARLGKSIHPDLRQYLLEASDVVFGTFEPVTIAPPAGGAGHRDMAEVCEGAWEEMEVPRKYMPFCEDNGDFYCIDKRGGVVFWSHNDGDVTEAWEDLATWIEEVWIGEA